MKSLRASKVFCVIDLIHYLPLILEVKEVVTITVKELLKGNAPVHLFEVAICFKVKALTNWWRSGYLCSSRYSSSFSCPE
jgi:hypothetical protein